MAQPRRCTFCGGGCTLTAEWAYLAASQTKLATMVLPVRCKWCRGTGLRARGSSPKEAS